MQEWSAQDSAHGPPCQWVHVAPHAERHDAAHLVTHRATLGLAELAQLVTPLASFFSGVEGAPAQAARRSVLQYRSLLLGLDDAVGSAVDAALASIPALNEPGVARQLARQLPPGYALFLGNSMPIRDMEMYACPRPSNSNSNSNSNGASFSGGWEEAAAGGQATAAGSGAAAGAAAGAEAAKLVGVPIAANRGASGIDGVLSTAAGALDAMDVFKRRLGIHCCALQQALAAAFQHLLCCGTCFKPSFQ